MTEVTTMRVGPLPRPTRLLGWALALLPAALGCGGPVTVSTEPRAAQPETPPTVGAVPRIRDIPLGDPKVNKPVDTYTADEFAVQTTDEFYKFVREHINRVVEVNGTVESVTTQPTGHLTARLLTRTGKGKWLDLNVNEPQPLPKVQPGQRIVARGTVRGGVVVPNWLLVSVSGDPPRAVTAAEFAKEYEADEAAVRAKREGKFFILTGEIETVDLPGPDAKVCTVRFKAGGATAPVTAVFPNGETAEKQRNAGFKPGDTIHVVGECDVGTTQLVRCSIFTH
jgi:hypothetical protein